MRYIILIFLVLINNYGSAQCVLNTSSNDCNSCDVTYTTNQTTISVINGKNYCIPFEKTITVDDLVLNSGKLIVCGKLDIKSSIDTKRSGTAEIIINNGELNIGTSSSNVNFKLGSSKGITIIGGSSYIYGDISINSGGYISLSSASSVMKIYGNLTLATSTLSLMNRGSFYLFQRNGSGGVLDNNSAPNTICLENSYNEIHTYKNTISDAIQFKGTSGIAIIKTINTNLFWNNLISTGASNVYLCYNNISNPGSTGLLVSNINSNCSTPLPLEFLDINYNITSKTLTWITADEKNVEKFVVYVSENTSFKPFCEVTAYNKTSSKYSININEPDISYIYVEAIDFDGNVSVSRTIYIEKYLESKIYPNYDISKHGLNIYMESFDTNTMCYITDIHGKIVYSKKIDENESYIDQTEFISLPKSIYFVELITDSNVYIYKIEL
jgi:hypothetical protein